MSEEVEEILKDFTIEDLEEIISKYDTERDSFSIYEDEFNRLENLTSREFSLLKYCVNNRNQKTNTINFGKKNILKKLNMQRQHFWTYKNKLVKENFIVETDTKNEYLINPRFCCSTSIGPDEYMELQIKFKKLLGEAKYD